MKRTSCSLPVLLVTAVTTLLNACGQRNEIEPERLIDIDALDYMFAAPDTVEAGVVTLRLWQRGIAFHNLEVVRIDAGHTAAEWRQAAIARRLPSWATNLGGPGFAEAGESANATLLLEPGT